MKPKTNPVFTPEQQTVAPGRDDMTTNSGQASRHEGSAPAQPAPIIPLYPSSDAPDESAERLTPQSTVADLGLFVKRRYWGGLKHSAAVNYTNILKYNIFPALGPLPLKALEDLELIEDLIIEWRESALKPGTISSRISVLVWLYDAAIARDLIKKNPLKQARKLLKKKKWKKFRATPFSAEDEAQLVEAFKTLAPRYHCLLLLLLRTGMRIGEALALKLEDIDWKLRKIRINATWTCGIEDTPKYESDRVIAISDDLFLVLQAYYKSIKYEEPAGWLKPTGLLFPGKSRETPLSLAAFRRDVWKVLLADLGICYRRIHDLRHTFATSVLRAGARIELVSSWLGHTDVGFTHRTYCHLLDQAHDDIVKYIGVASARSLPPQTCPACRRPLDTDLSPAPWAVP